MEILKAGRNLYIPHKENYRINTYIKSYIVGLSSEDKLITAWIPKNTPKDMDPSSLKSAVVTNMVSAYYVEAYYTAFNVTLPSTIIYRISDAFTKELITTLSHTNHPDCCGESIIALDYNNIESSKFNLEVIFGVLLQLKMTIGSLGHNFSFVPGEYYSSERRNKFSGKEKELFSNNECTRINDTLYMKQFGLEFGTQYIKALEYLKDFHKNCKIEL